MQVDPKLGQMRIPDILETIADLSNDEVFTPPDLANKVLDMLPQEIWSNSKITFLDPACKTGVFLREITKRLIEGLKDEMPDLQERVNHILTKQVYGLGITELTALMSRRTIYCATKANSEASVVTAFDNPEGNIKFPKSKHKFNEKTKKCEICGAGEDLYGEIPGLDNYAYSFLHDNLKEVFGNVKFDVIIGNPPYQLNVGNEGANSGKAIAIYHLFIEKAIEMNPKYITMIVPSRWMSNTAEGISKEWVEKMLKSNQIKKINDYENSKDLFSSVMVRGGINYFLWDSEHNGKCDYKLTLENGEVSNKLVNLDPLNLGFVIRDFNFLPIMDKVEKVEGKYYLKETKNFSGYVGPKDYYCKDGVLTSNWKGYSKVKTKDNVIKYYVSEFRDGLPFGWIKDSEVKKGRESINKHKLFIPAVGGVPRYGEPGSVASQTYLAVGYSHNLTKKECLNMMRYMSTKFFWFMVRAKKVTPNGARGVYQLVPNQDWTKEISDKNLYEKYNLTKEEINYIEKVTEVPSLTNIQKEIDIALSL